MNIILWLSLMLVPAVNTNIVQDTCPVYRPAKFSCYYPAINTMYLDPNGYQPAGTFYHEMGHAFDSQALTDTDRAKLKRMFGYKQSRNWDWTGADPIKRFHKGRQPPIEEFAINYALCATTPAMLTKKICTFIKKRGKYYPLAT